MYCSYISIRFRAIYNYILGVPSPKTGDKRKRSTTKSVGMNIHMCFFF